MIQPLVIPSLLLGLVLAPMPQEPHEPGQVRKELPSQEEIAKLPADGGPEFNRLVFSQSPYLLQHARNPVDWWPWNDEAFAAAKAQDKPVFLSIGYSTCHWCHVMEHESFEDAEVAALMNANFICIKVDREERPDVDHVYMTVTQALTKRGGWPMTVILTPEREAFFAGTYFPKQGRGGRPGMMDLLPQIGDVWKTRRAELVAEAQRITQYLQTNAKGSPGGTVDSSALVNAESELARRYDPAHGGFSQAPKFPVPHNLRFLLRRHAVTGDTAVLNRVTKTLRKMRLGGMWDQVGFGFHRYSTDRTWLVPHFEKMLYDQALLAMAYTEAWLVTDEPLFRQTVEEIFTYILRDMTDPGGGFYSAEDADSEGEEGLFYLWTRAQLIEILGEEDGALAARVWNVKEKGNFRDEVTGKNTERNIPHLAKTLPNLAKDLEMDPEVLSTRLESIRKRLFDVREGRIHPLKDDKVLTDWNGLAIAALALAGRSMEEPRYTDAAVRAAEFAYAELRDPKTGRLHKRWRLGKAGLDGMLEDYAFMSWGLIELFQTTQDVRWLAWAKELCDLAITHFADESGGFFLSPGDGEALIVRAKEIYDGALPSGNSVMALNLARLARLTGETDYEERAQGVLNAFAGQVAQNASAHAQLMCAVDFLMGATNEIVIAGDPQAEDTRALLHALETRFLPNAVVVLRPNEGNEALLKLVPYAAEQVPTNERATAYVCREFACKVPVNDVDAMLDNLATADEE